MAIEPKEKNRRWSAEEIEKIDQLHKSGKTWTEIAAQYGIARSSVYTAWFRAKHGKTPKEKSKPAVMVYEPAPKKKVDEPQVVSLPTLLGRIESDIKLIRQLLGVR